MRSVWFTAYTFHSHDRHIREAIRARIIPWSGDYPSQQFHTTTFSEPSTISSPDRIPCFRQNFAALLRFLWPLHSLPRNEEKMAGSLAGGLKRLHEALHMLATDPTALDHARKRFNPPPPENNSNISGTTTLSETPNPISDEQRLKEEQYYEAQHDRGESLPWCPSPRWEEASMEFDISGE